MIIGIVANQSEEDRFWLNTSYIRYFKTLGLVTFIDPLDQEIDKVDMLVMPGGADISPGRYGMPHLPNIGFPNRPYEVFDHFTLPRYIEAGIPIFGICRGHQSIHVHFGGTLHPHVEEPTSGFEGETAHFVGNEDRSIMFPTSSNHHQAVDRIGHGFEPLLYGYRIVKNKKEGEKAKFFSGERLHLEAAINREARIATVQWHPEKNHAAESHPEAQAFVANLIREITA